MIGLVAVHLHHTTQLIQVQGSMIMPDLTSSAVWFVKHCMEDRFTNMSRVHHFSIQAYHNALLALSKPYAPSPALPKSSSHPCCDDCKKMFQGNSKPVPCFLCSATVHATCFKTQICFLSRQTPQMLKILMLNAHKL